MKRLLRQPHKGCARAGLVFFYSFLSSLNHPSIHSWHRDGGHNIAGVQTIEAGLEYRSGIRFGLFIGEMMIQVGGGVDMA